MYQVLIRPPCPTLGKPGLSTPSASPWGLASQWKSWRDPVPCSNQQRSTLLSTAISQITIYTSCPSDTHPAHFLEHINIQANLLYFPPQPKFLRQLKSPKFLLFCTFISFYPNTKLFAQIYPTCSLTGASSCSQASLKPLEFIHQLGKTLIREQLYLLGHFVHTALLAGSLP